MIAARTKAALQAAKARGVRLGRHGADCLASANRASAIQRAARLKPILEELTARRMSIRQIAAELTERGIVPLHGGRWHPQSVSRILRRAATL
ncbi:MAG: recombinase family protein [Xanthobacteraceae bacterium]